MNGKECCGNCKFYFEFGHKDEVKSFGGVCRKRPPETGGRKSYGFPSTDKDWWCGEWKPKDKVEERDNIVDKEEETPISKSEIKWWSETK